MKRLQRLYFGCIAETLVIGKSEVKYWVNGRAGFPQVMSVKVSHRTSGDLDLVVCVYSGVPLRAR